MWIGYYSAEKRSVDELALMAEPPHQASGHSYCRSLSSSFLEVFEARFAALAGKGVAKAPMAHPPPSVRLCSHCNDRLVSSFLSLGGIRHAYSNLHFLCT